MKNHHWFKLVLLLWGCLTGAIESNVIASENYFPAYSISLNGHLNKEKIDDLTKNLAKLGPEAKQTILIEINSSSGNIGNVLELAHTLYAMKHEQKLTLKAFINNQAVGPAAIIPFLADEIESTPLAIWGDITADSELALPQNLLKSRIYNLIPLDSPKQSLLKLLAEAMIDPNLVVLEGQDGKWLEQRSIKEKVSQVVKAEKETLVLNQYQMQALGLIQRAISKEKLWDELGVVASPVLHEIEELLDQTIVTKGSSSDIAQRLRKFIPYKEGQSHVIGHIAINDRKRGINDTTWIYVKSALDYYKKIRPQFIILELNTPGGEVFAAQRISDALKDIDTHYDIPVVALVNNWAISAGAMLAYSCRFIVLVKDASMGAAEPITIEEGQAKSVSEKFNSALRTDMANRANFFGRDPLIAQAMVDKDLVLVWRHGRVVQLNDDKEIRSSGANPDIVITTKGKLLTLQAQHMIDFKVADVLLPVGKLESITGEELDSGKWPITKSPLFLEPYFATDPQATIDSYQNDWHWYFLSFLTHPIVSSVLVLGLMVGFYIEVNTPGFGVPGTIALICLFFLILSHIAVDMTGPWLELTLLLAGFVFIAIEAYFFATSGGLAVLGAILAVAGLIGLLLPNLKRVKFDSETQSWDLAGLEAFKNITWLAGTFFIGFTIITFLARYFVPKFTKLTKLVLNQEQNAVEGYISGVLPETLPTIGTIGKTITPLRPFGKVEFGDKIFEASSEGWMVDSGQRVRVIALEGSKLVVKLENDNRG
ncbi:MAG: hypothetical protein K0S74_1001 [Chlamydiales bacterium]|jgi:membrane-bound ClpP family serine protease|nr:hypothetical protein [Chlamydiales bacterium]